VTENGPLVFKGEIRLLDPSETPVATATTALLCRCGQSQNQPYCDKSHKDAGFCHSAITLEGNYGELAADELPLDVEPLANGPLFVSGSFDLISSDGQTICQGNKTTLCRCGLSENKPFCDGSHKEGGFQGAVMGA
jgi:CDGSH-type Zn-finger protein